jgi:hypothetical protein
VDYFKYLGSLIINDARYGQEIKYWFAMVKATFNKNTSLFTSKFDSNLGKKLMKCYIWNIALYGAETSTLRKVDKNAPKVLKFGAAEEEEEEERRRRRRRRKQLLDDLKN